MRRALMPLALLVGCQGGAPLPATAVDMGTFSFPPPCSDGTIDGDETDVDCGGSCSPCPSGMRCSGPRDCQTNVCAGSVCTAASCSDGLKDGAETDVDCGGGTCLACAAGKRCVIWSDCASAACTMGACVSPLSCAPPLANCDGNVVSGCNIHLDSDPKNCGQCGKACMKPNSQCVRGACQAGLNVLLVHSDDANAGKLSVDVSTRLIATGSFATVDVFDAGQATPDAKTLAQYQAVLLTSNNAFKDAATLGNNLAAFEDGGGRVVMTYAGTAYTDMRQPGGAFAARYLLVQGPMLRDMGAGLGTIRQPQSPLVAGVKSLSAQDAYRGVGGTLVNGAEVIAEWSDGTPLIVTATINGHVRVDVNMFTPSHDVFPVSWTGDGTTILRNALTFY